MSYTIKEFVELDLPPDRLMNGLTCSACSLPITDVPPNELPMLDGKPAHTSCYDAAVSELVEAHPVRRIVGG